MRAAQINQYGDAGVLKTVDNAAKPLPDSGEVLVEVYAAAVNPFDITVLTGRVKDKLPLQFPATLGGDLAGVVSELGQNVSGFSVGDEVFGQANAVSGRGSYAEYAPVRAQSLALKPKGVDFVTAAGLPLAGVSAIQALVDHINLQHGQKILIHGGAGGIGSFAIQIAKHLGAHVATTATAADSEYVKSLGADEVIDYTSQTFEDFVSSYDAVFDTVGGETTARSYSVLIPNGTLVSMVSPPDEDLMQKYSITALHQSTKVTSERLRNLAGLVEKGSIKVNIDRVFPLDEASKALSYLQTGAHKGKVVLKVK